MVTAQFSSDREVTSGFANRKTRFSKTRFVNDIQLYALNNSTIRHGFFSFCVFSLSLAWARWLSTAEFLDRLPLLQSFRAETVVSRGLVSNLMTRRRLVRVTKLLLKIIKNNIRRYMIKFWLLISYTLLCSVVLYAVRENIDNSVYVTRKRTRHYISIKRICNSVHQSSIRLGKLLIKRNVDSAWLLAWAIFNIISQNRDHVQWNLKNVSKDHRMKQGVRRLFAYIKYNDRKIRKFDVYITIRENDRQRSETNPRWSVCSLIAALAPTFVNP